MALATIGHGLKMDQSTRTKEMTADEARVPAAQLGAFVARALAAAGLPEAEAQTVARYMGRGGFARQRHTWRDPATALRAPATRRWHQCRAEYSGHQRKRFGGADRRRQWHGPSGDALRRHIRDIRQSQRLPGVDRIWLPGEQTHAKLLDRRDRGSHAESAARESRCRGAGA